MKVTACVIVKNEEKNIGSWLESARHLSDEMVVVDTGSEDRTKELAAAGGARVLDFPWCQPMSQTLILRLQTRHRVQEAP